MRTWKTIREIHEEEQWEALREDVTQRMKETDDHLRSLCTWRTRLKMKLMDIFYWIWDNLT